MAVYQNFTTEKIERVGSVLQTYVYSGRAAQKISRASISDLPYVGDGGPESHPTFSGLIKDSETLWPLEGQITCTYTWLEEDDSDIVSYLNDWKALVERVDTTVTINEDARQATVIIDGNYNHADWVSHPTKWILKSPKAKATANIDSKIVCIDKLVDADQWTCEYLCVEAGNSKEITKQGTDCFMFISGQSTINSTSFDSNELIKIKSDSVTLTATNRCVVVRLYK